MSRYSQSYSKFCVSLAEVHCLQSEAQKLSKKIGAKSYNLSIAMSRAGVLLLCAHVEAYFEDIVGEILRQAHDRKIPKTHFGKSMLTALSADLIQTISNTEDPEAIANHVGRLFERDFDVWSNVAVFQKPIDYERITTPFSNPKYKNIKHLLRQIGFKEFDGKLQKRLAKQATIYTQMVDTVVQKRHAIAHGEIIEVTPLDLAQMAKIIKIFCNKSDGAICEWAKKIGCKIVN